MKGYSIKIFFVTAFFCCQAAAQHAVPDPPPVSARAYLLQDFYSGAVLAEVGADEPLEPASLTKMMTVYVVFDAIQNGRLKFDETARISEKAWRNPDVRGWTLGSRMFAEVGSMVRVDDLLHGLIVQSGNDAAVALAEHVAGSEEKFVESMNEYAERLGLAGTSFRNSTGWPVEGHYTTARDRRDRRADAERQAPRQRRGLRHARVAAA
jgi:D-alanyl-D-alanine carboxypeptidase (penicillin-binding protein 5/6)